MQCNIEISEPHPIPLKTVVERPVHQDRVLLGMAASAASIFMLNTMNMFAKLLSNIHPAIEVAFYRNLIAVIPFLIFIFFFGRRDLLVIHSRPGTLIIRSIAGTLSLIATFRAFNILPMADAQALLFTSSLFIPILGVFFLKERVGPYRWAAVIVGFLGTLVIIHPSGTANLTGISFAIFAALMHATLGTLLRILGRTERPETVTFYFLLIGMVITSISLPFVGTMPTTHEIPYFIGAGISGAFAQFFLSVAYKYAPAALVTIFNYTGIVWATTYDWFIWGDWPGQAVWIGSATIIASSAFILWREHKHANQTKISSESETYESSQHQRVS